MHAGGECVAVVAHTACQTSAKQEYIRYLFDDNISLEAE